MKRTDRGRRWIAPAGVMAALAVSLALALLLLRGGAPSVPPPASSVGGADSSLGAREGGAASLARRPEREDFAATKGPSLAEPPPRQAVRGIVVDDRGRPIASARVTVWAPQLRSALGRAASGSDGLFEVPLAPAAGSLALVEVVAEAEDHEEAVVRTEPGRFVTLRLPRRRATTLLVGRVTEPSGAPVGRFRLAWRAGEDARRLDLGEVAEEEGRFEVEVPVPVGAEAHGVLDVWAPDVGAGRAEVPVLADEARVEVVVVVRPGPRVEGIVEGPDGTAVAGANVVGFAPPPVAGLTGPVELAPERAAVTDADGRFTLLLDEGTPLVGLRVTASGFAPFLCVGEERLASIRDRDGLLRVRLSRGARIEGVVTLPDGRPAEGARVVLGRSEEGAAPGSFLAVADVVAPDTTEGPFGEEAARAVRTDASGHFVFQAVAPGVYRIEAQRAEGAVGRLFSPQRRVEVPGAGDPKPVVLVLGGGRSLEFAFDLGAFSFLPKGGPRGEPGSYLECRLYELGEAGDGKPGRFLAARGLTADRPRVSLRLPPDVAPGPKLLRLCVNPLMFAERVVRDPGTDATIEVTFTAEEVRRMLVRSARLQRGG